MSWDKKLLLCCIRSEFLKGMILVVPHYNDVWEKKGCSTLRAKEPAMMTQHFYPPAPSGIEHSVFLVGNIVILVLGRVYENLDCNLRQIKFCFTKVNGAFYAYVLYTAIHLQFSSLFAEDGVSKFEIKYPQNWHFWQQHFFAFIFLLNLL